MKMDFHRTGKQFFFITISVMNRAKVLSHLVDEKSRPELLPYGAAVKSLLASLHKAFPCVTVSDFAIMPDHVHFLMMVNYSLNSTFSPLWATHRLMDAAEIMWESDGDTIPEPLAALNMAISFAKENRGRLTLANRISPAVSLKKFSDNLISENALASQKFKGNIPLQSAFPVSQGFGGGTPPSVPRWDRHCYIELSFDSRQLKTIRRYIRLNPARALWKAKHPDRFIRFANIRYPILDSERHWDAMGNLTLLASPFLYHVRLTMRKSVEEHSAEIETVLEQVQRGLIPVSGFISPGEKELLRRLKAEPRARFIKTVPFSLPPRYDPSAEDSRELAADRLLILSGFPQGTADSRENLRARCNIMNDLAATLCAKAAMRE